MVIASLGRSGTVPSLSSSSLSSSSPTSFLCHSPPTTENENKSKTFTATAAIITTTNKRSKTFSMFSKVKDTTRSMVQEVRNNLDPSKRNSVDEKRRSRVVEDNVTPNTISPNNANADTAHAVREQPQKNSNNSSRRSLSLPRQKIPIIRPFTIQKGGSSSDLDEEADEEYDESVYSTSIDTAGHHFANEDHHSDVAVNADTEPSATTETEANAAAGLGAGAGAATAKAAPFDAAALARADVLCGSERPGIMATACEFQIAKEKKNEDFHSIFKSIDETDILIDVYKCALQKDILLQGHLYVSEQHVCFKSNIFGFVTNIVMKYSEINKVEKRMTARVIPNGILIETESATHIFASLLSRDQAYDQLIKIWNLRKKASSIAPSLNKPAEPSFSADEAGDIQSNDATGTLPSPPAGNTDNTASNMGLTLPASSPDSAIMLNTPPLLITDKDSFEQHQKNLIEQQRQQKAATPPEEPEEADTNEHASPLNEITTTATSNSSPAENHSSEPVEDHLDVFSASKIEEQQRPRAASDSNTTPVDTSAIREPIITETTKPLNISTADSATAMTNAPAGKEAIQIVPLKKSRVCPCTIKNEQFHHVALNQIYTGTVESMYKLLFDSEFLRNFLERYEAFEDVDDGAWRRGRREVTGKRRVKSTTSGTKIVKVLFQEKKAHRKFPYYCCITATKSMPDMPMGAVYSIQTRTCITRVHKDKVHVLVTFQVAFTQSGIVSSIIEKNAADDQFRLYNRLNAVLHRPELIEDLIANDQHGEFILNSLQITTKAEKEARIQAIERRKWSLILCVGLMIILFTHFLLAFRLQRIIRHMDVIKRHRQDSLYQNPISGPIQQKISYREYHPIFHESLEEVHRVGSQLKQIEKHLSSLQLEANNYNERLRKLKQESD